MFFMILYMYIAPGQGKTAHRGQNFNADRNVLSLHSFNASLKMSLKSDFKRFFLHDLVHVHSPGAGADSPQGTNFDFTRMALSLFLFVASFKEISLKSDFIHFFFHYLIHVYRPGAGGKQPPGDKVLMSTEAVVVPYCYLFLMSVFILWFSYYVSDIFCKF